MSIRTIKFELEAKLRGKGGFFSRPGGKVERKSYASGEERLKISLWNLKVPVNSLATVKADNMEIARIPLMDGKGRIDVESTDFNDIPGLAAGQEITVYVDDRLVLRGEVYVD